METAKQRNLSLSDSESSSEKQTKFTHVDLTTQQSDEAIKSIIKPIDHVVITFENVLSDSIGLQSTESKLSHPDQARSILNLLTNNNIKITILTEGQQKKVEDCLVKNQIKIENIEIISLEEQIAFKQEYSTAEKRSEIVIKMMQSELDKITQCNKTCFVNPSQKLCESAQQMGFHVIQAQAALSVPRKNAMHLAALGHLCFDPYSAQLAIEGLKEYESSKLDPERKKTTRESASIGIASLVGEKDLGKKRAVMLRYLLEHHPKDPISAAYAMSFLFVHDDAGTTHKLLCEKLGFANREDAIAYYSHLTTFLLADVIKNEQYLEMTKNSINRDVIGNMVQLTNSNKTLAHHPDLLPKLNKLFVDLNKIISKFVELDKNFIAEQEELRQQQQQQLNQQAIVVSNESNKKDNVTQKKKSFLGSSLLASFFDPDKDKKKQIVSEGSLAEIEKKTLDDIRKSKEEEHNDITQKIGHVEHIIEETAVDSVITKEKSFTTLLKEIPTNKLTSTSKSEDDLFDKKEEEKKVIVKEKKELHIEVKNEIETVELIKEEIETLEIKKEIKSELGSQNTLASGNTVDASISGEGNSPRKNSNPSVMFQTKSRSNSTSSKESKSEEAKASSEEEFTESNKMSMSSSK